MWPLLIISRVISYVRATSAASEAIKGEVLLKAAAEYTKSKITKKKLKYVMFRGY